MTTFTLGILAGGQGRRVAGRDKGWLDWHGKALVRYPLERFANDAGAILINANRSVSEYQQLPAEVVGDLRSGFPGPLAGIESLLTHCLHWPLVVLPCDMPQLPTTLPARLVSAVSPDTPISVAHDGQRQQHLCLAFANRQPLASLSAYLDQGQHSVYGWLQSQAPKQVHFAEGTDAFANINRLDPTDPQP